MEMFTQKDMRQQLDSVLDAMEGQYDRDAVLRDLQQRYGTRDLDTIDTVEFWAVVSWHAE